MSILYTLKNNLHLYLFELDTTQTLLLLFYQVER